MRLLSVVFSVAALALAGCSTNLARSQEPKPAVPSSLPSSYARPTSARPTAVTTTPQQRMQKRVQLAMEGKAFLPAGPEVKSSSDQIAVAVDELNPLIRQLGPATGLFAPSGFAVTLTYDKATGLLTVKTDKDTYVLLIAYVRAEFGSTEGTKTQSIVKVNPDGSQESVVDGTPAKHKSYVLQCRWAGNDTLSNHPNGAIYGRLD